MFLTRDARAKQVGCCGGSCLLHSKTEAFALVVLDASVKLVNEVDNSCFFFPFSSGIFQRYYYFLTPRQRRCRLLGILRLIPGFSLVNLKV